MWKLEASDCVETDMDSADRNQTKTLTTHRRFMRYGPEVVRAKLIAGEYLRDPQLHRDAILWLKQFEEVVVFNRRNRQAQYHHRVRQVNWIAGTACLVALLVLLAGLGLIVALR
jgi:hypothetical protein